MSICFNFWIIFVSCKTTTRQNSYMCTVTLIPKGEKEFILTSNRDEAPHRDSLTPSFHEYKNTKLLFPKDTLSGGTWIGVSEKNRVICVLNGGFEIHNRQLPYRQSRGVVATDFMVANSVIETVESYNFHNIEPFTMVIIDWNFGLKWYELVWDGCEKYFTELPLKPNIWSSSSLYNQAMKEERIDWFERFLNKTEIDSKAILQFHKTAGANNSNYGIIINRGFVKTTSITQIEKKNQRVEMRYENLQDKLVHTERFHLLQNS